MVVVVAVVVHAGGGGDTAQRPWCANRLRLAELCSGFLVTLIPQLTHLQWTNTQNVQSAFQFIYI